jgi:WD40 repeat protein
MATANPEKLKVTKQHNLKFIALTIARHAKSNRVFVGGSDFKIYATDPSAEKLDLKEIGKHETYVTSVALADETLISGGYDGRLNWWDTAKPALIRSLESHTKWIRNVVVSPDGKLVASVADDMVCKVHETATGKLVHELRGHMDRTPTGFLSMLYACAFSPDGKTLATGDKVGHIELWDVATGKSIGTLESPGMYTWDGRQRIHSIGGIRTVAFSPDGKQLAVGGIGKIGNIDHLDGPARIEVFDVSSGKSVHLFEKTKFKGLINRLIYEPQGEWLLSAGGAGNGFFVFVDIKKGKVTKEETAKFHVHALELSEKAESFVAVGHNGMAVYEMKG